MPMLDHEWREADRLSRNGRWEDAGPRWWALAQRCRTEGMASRAQDAASRAADAFRRDDRPAAAVDALRMAWSLGQSTPHDLVELSAVLLDAGEAEAAEVAARSAADRARSPAEAALSLDALFNVLLTRGEVAEAAALHGRVPPDDNPEHVLAYTFQAARLARLDGLLHTSDARYAAVAERLAPYPAAAAGLAAVLDARAEVALTRAVLARIAGRDPERWIAAAGAWLDDGATAWQRARRKAGRNGNEALAAIREQLAGGGVAPTSLDRALQYAQERGLALATAEWSGIRAAISGDPTDLDRALGAAAECPLVRGRARLGWLERVAVEEGPGNTGPQLEAAALELVDDKPAVVRLLAAHALLTRDKTLAAAARHQARALLDAG